MNPREQSPYQRALGKIEADAEVIAEWQHRLQAIKLRNLGLTYSAIAVVMSEYHHVNRSGDGWRKVLQKAGVKGKRRGGEGARFR